MTIIFTKSIKIIKNLKKKIRKIKKKTVEYLAYQYLVQNPNNYLVFQNEGYLETCLK